jgi:glycosyltransferase involved in cell wall biosynthesis
MRLKIGYVPYSINYERPGDRRRFIFYAKKRNIQFENADPNKKYDIVILTQNADISLWTRYKKNNIECKIIYDAIDSYITIPRNSIKGCFRGIAKFITRQSKYLQINHWKAIKQLCTIVDAVVCSTQEQYEQLIKYSNNVHINLDAHIDVAKCFKDDYNSSIPFKLVWEGLPENIAGLENLIFVLKEIEKKYRIELNIISDEYFFKYLGKFGKTKSIRYAEKITNNLKFHVWNEKNLSNIICECDLAIIPLNLNDKFAAGKPENKLLLFWRLGMPVITSSTPAYVRAMENSGIKNYAVDANDWYTLIISMIEKKEMREISGTNGKKYVEVTHSEKKIIERWDLIFDSIGANFR